MTFFYSLPVVCSALLIAAHFYRAGLVVFAGLALLCTLLLFVRKKWAAQALISLLILGAIEWLHTLYVLVGKYQMHGIDWHRMVVIIGGVGIFTLASSLVFLIPAMRRRYHLTSEPD